MEEENEKEDQTLFIEDNGKVTITEFARKFYSDKGLDPEKMAKEWEQASRHALNKKKRLGDVNETD